MNPADYLKTYQLPELEKIAHKEIKKLGDSLTIPVDIEEIVENFNDIEIDIHRGLKDNHHTWGMVSRDLETDKFVIMVDDTLLDIDHLKKIYRMTIAEEFAHILLHKKAIEKVSTLDDFKALQNHGNWHKHERNAKRLAAMILMPSANVLNDSRKLYTQFVQHIGFEKPQVLKKFLTSKMADRYEVSNQSMTFRLDEWPIKVLSKIDEAMKNQLDFLD
ncbi:MAG: ImmA/IrrE family metallo-endopeptidase [Sedimentisphaerales bacterium]|nr:ImmA/IrrE family metallo-endopeptidase [Sedimentisphaerales bacterium]